MTNLTILGLALLALGALVGLLQRRWSLPALLLALAGTALAAYGFFAAPAEPGTAKETVLASDAEPGVTRSARPQAAGADAVAGHTVPGETRPWVHELARLTRDPEAYPLFNSGVAEDGLNAGDRYYEYAKLELPDRALDVVFLTRSPNDPDVWMLHLEPGEGRPPVATGEFGTVTVIGQGEGYLLFQIDDGPFAGNYLVWAVDEDGEGGWAVRIYTPAYLDREHARAQPAG
ncbi:hypothetical protein [Oceanithermus sp.]